MSRPEILFELETSDIKELSPEEKKDLLSALRRMKSSIAWGQYSKILKTQVNVRVTHLITTPPKNILEDGVRDAFLNGECNGMLTSMQLLDILIDSLDSEMNPENSTNEG